MIAVSLLMLGCPKPGPTPQPVATAKAPEMAELSLLMKNEINPAFSKITFLVFHGEDMEEDPAALKGEMERYASSLRKSLGRLRVWQHPPTQSTEGREVFYTYALSVDKSAERLLDAIGRADTQGAAQQLEHIAKTCNSCHHFFRLDIKDSVVGPGAVTESEPKPEPPPPEPSL